MYKAIAIISLFTYQYTQAQTDTQQTKKLEEVIVTGQHKPQSIKNSVHQIIVIGKDRIQKQGAVNLQTVLSNELNIRFSQDAATGGSDITMMGLKGQNVKILIDGLPMVGRQGTSNEININQIDINIIERIEIIEGPMSVVYGADALAGVINIITKKNKNATLSIFAKQHEETIGREFDFTSKGIHNTSVGLNWHKKNWAIGGNLSYNYFGGWKDTAIQRELTWHKKDQIIGGAYVGFTKNRLSLNYRIDGLDEIITNPANFDIYPNPISGDYTANDQQYLSKRVMQQLQTNYNFNNKVQANLQAAYTGYSRQVYSTILSKKTGKETLNSATGSQAMVNFNGITARGFVNYILNKKISIQPGLDINLDRGNGERLSTGNNKVDDYALFVTSEINATPKLNIKPGIRVIKNSVYKAPPIVPSLNIKYAFLKNVDARFSYAHGFRSPSLRELYFNFFDANHQILGNPNLKAETSNSFTTAFNWYNNHKKNNIEKIVVSAFYNNINNMIDYVTDATNNNIFILSNVSKSKTAGVSLNSNYNFKQLSISIGTAYTGFYNDYYNSDKSLPQLQWTPEANASIGYSITKLGLDANFYYKLIGKKPFYTTNSSQVVEQAIQKSYQLADFTINKKLFKYLTINTGLRNVFNVKNISSATNSGSPHTNGGLKNIATGRSYFLGINFNLDKK
jgi:outer membrane receptor for ferrienterochelin and colicins